MVLRDGCSGGFALSTFEQGNISIILVYANPFNDNPVTFRVAENPLLVQRGRAIHTTGLLQYVRANE